LEKKALGWMITAGWIAAAILGAFTAALAIQGAEGLTRLNLVDAAIYFGLAYGIYRHSRISAVAALAYHLFNQYMLIEVQHASLNPAGLILALIFAGAFAASIAGTFLWHSREDASGASHRESRSARGSGKVVER
jgi:hypothetical protein